MYYLHEPRAVRAPKGEGPCYVNNRYSGKLPRAPTGLHLACRFFLEGSLVKHPYSACVQTLHVAYPVCTSCLNQQLQLSQHVRHQMALLPQPKELQIPIMKLQACRRPRICCFKEWTEIRPWYLIFYRMCIWQKGSKAAVCAAGADHAGLIRPLGKGVGGGWRDVEALYSKGAGSTDTETTSLVGMLRRQQILG